MDELRRATFERDRRGAALLEEPGSKERELTQRVFQTVTTDGTRARVFLRGRAAAQGSAVRLSPGLIDIGSHESVNDLVEQGRDVVEQLRLAQPARFGHLWVIEHAASPSLNQRLFMVAEKRRELQRSNGVISFHVGHGRQASSRT
ncbi:hypothetical protein WMF22_18460 [Sorangium sp. So ce204]